MLKFSACLFVIGFAVISGSALADNSKTGKRISGQATRFDEVELQNMRLQPSGVDGYEFVGRIRNKSKKNTLRSLEINLIILDCVAISGERNCTIIGERKESIYLTVPPGQERGFKEAIYIYGDLLDPKGEVVWEVKVLSVKSG